MEEHVLLRPCLEIAIHMEGLSGHETFQDPLAEKGW